MCELKICYSTIYKIYLLWIIFSVLNIRLLNIGKTEVGLKKEWIDKYIKRFKPYAQFTYEDIITTKGNNKLDSKQRCLKEGNALLKKVNRNEYLVLLDENGKEFTSREFASWINKKINSGITNICFATGGAYGFSEEVCSSAKEKISLSKMTLTHQMVRVLFVEQIYRAFSILNNHPYHNE